MQDWKENKRRCDNHEMRKNKMLNEGSEHGRSFNRRFGENKFNATKGFIRV